MMSDPLVSVWMVTYNHEKYLAQALDGVLMQQANFNIEVIIGEDCSTDGTRDVLEEYVKRNPDIIRPVYHEQNVGGYKNAYEFTLPLCKGKYIACLEGDDYWTDPLKLQKQVDFLEANPDYVFTFHDSVILNQNSGETRLRIGDRKIDVNIDLKSLILQNNIPTASIVFRNVLDHRLLPDWFAKITKADYGLCVLLAEKGPGKFLPGAMSVYRVHDGGAWSGNGFEFTHTANLRFYKYLLEYFKDNEIRRAIRAKMQLSKFNYGIAKLRIGHLFEGLFLALRNLRLTGDRRVRTSLRKVASAIKSWLKAKFSAST